VNAVGPVFDAARRAFREAWGTEAVDIGAGGTIPFVKAFADAYPEAAILLTGVEDPDGRAHGANESLLLDDFRKVCLAETLLLHELAG
jgi:acetylornithine deacetylase/succinyl-diaminopimelate desuccinylase-like protein